MSVEVKYSEEILLQRAADGNKAAFVRLFDLYKNKLHHFLFVITGSPELTEDIIQNIFLKLWANRSSLPEIRNFGAYLFRMCRNQAINALKRMAKETAVLADLQVQYNSVKAEAEETIFGKEAEEKLNQALMKLPPQQKLVFTLSRVEGLKYHEIARRLQIAPATVRNHMIEALKTIRKYFYQKKLPGR